MITVPQKIHKRFSPKYGFTKDAKRMLTINPDS